MKEWLKNVKSGQQNAVSSYEEYLEKIAKPQLEAYRKTINPAFVSRAGLTADEIIRKRQEKLFSKEGWEKYIKGFSAKEITQIIDALPKKSADFARKKTFGDWRLEGGLTADGQSALEIIKGWLAGDKKVVKALRAQDKLVQGGPVYVLGCESKHQIPSTKFQTNPNDQNSNDQNNLF
ncbi:MAG: hypothetical protein HY762_01455 [Planctomycetes bacterium]|nr:hypothetical protein [Planctomycetota bacterium]